MLLRGHFMITNHSSSALMEFENCESRVNVTFVAKLLWERVLSDGDRRKLGATFRDALSAHPNTTAMWMALHPRQSQEQSVLEAARALGSIDETTYDWLRREVVCARRSISPSRRPEWNRTRGELKLGRKIIRRVRVGVAVNIVKILDAFEEEGWPERIDSPIARASDDMAHRDAISSLNKNLVAVRFRSDGTGTGMLWELFTPSTVSSSHRP
jgi:hypothetical protein